MNYKIQGGPAFPQAVMNDEGEIYYFHDWHGMSLRDYFAAKALQGICASGPSVKWTSEMLAKESYELADAMLKARKA